MNVLRAAATELRDSGYSYSYISDELGVAKSTLSNWFRDRPFVPNEDTILRIKTGQAKYGQSQRKRRQDEITYLLEKGIKEVGFVSHRDLWMIGLGLWLGEGSKTVEQIRLANSDPYVIKLWVRWLQEICKIPKENITARIHLYADNNVDSSILYWQDVTGLSKSAFRKTLVDQRTLKKQGKKGKLPHGTIHIGTIANSNSDFGVKLYRRMKGWVSAILQ